MSWVNGSYLTKYGFKKGFSAAALAAIFLSTAASADDSSFMTNYLTIQGTPKVQVIQETSLPPELRSFADILPDSGSVGSTLGEANMVLDQIINMGKKVWDIIAANKPVVNFQTDTANALPQGASGWEALEGWQQPASRLYRFTYQNVYGWNVVDFQFRVLYYFGGNVGGKGRYLANVTVVPADLSVAWGYTFNAQASVPSVLNAGTSADPVAAAELLVSWKIDTVMKHEQTSESFDVRGDGSFTDLSNGN